MLVGPEAKHVCKRMQNYTQLCLDAEMVPMILLAVSAVDDSEEWKVFTPGVPPMPVADLRLLLHELADAMVEGSQITLGRKGT